jgi:hypothetical protein
MSDCPLFYQLTERDKEALMPQQVPSSDFDMPMIHSTTDDREPTCGEHEALLCLSYPQVGEGTLQQNISKPYFARGCNISAEQLEALATEENTVTAWETALRNYRTKRWVFCLKIW